MLNALADFWSSYSILIVAALPVIALFSLQYCLCARTGRWLPRAIPFLLPLMMDAMQLDCIVISPTSSFYYSKELSLLQHTRRDFRKIWYYSSLVPYDFMNCSALLLPAKNQNKLPAV